MRDKVIKCCDCGNDFLFTIGEQEFYRDKGFTNEPRRCPTCRMKRKAAGGGDQQRGGRNERNGDREMWAADCAGCGTPCQVPFRPTGAKPVFCSDCFRQRKAAAANA